MAVRLLLPNNCDPSNAMAHSHIVIYLLVSLACSSYLITTVTADEHFLQLGDDLFEMRNIFAEKNRMDILELQVAQLSAQLTQLEYQNKILMKNLALQHTSRKTNVLNQANAIGEQPSAMTINQMPSSCGDLNAIGHTLNGLYNILGKKSMESVYCNFTNSPNDPGFQTWIGYVDIKSSPSYFYVRRNQTFNETRTPILFDIELLNEGADYDTTTGYFTAPVTGKYFFSLSGMAAFPMTFFVSRLYFQIGLFKNEESMAFAIADEVDVYYQDETFSLQSTLELIKGDRISVQIQSMSQSVSLSAGMFTQFNGFLLEEDILQSLGMF